MDKTNRYNELMNKKQAMTKAEIAQEFLELTERGEVQKAFDKYVAETFKHHNPRFKGDRETMIATMEKTAEAFPKLVSDRVHILEDGDFVAIHSHIKPVPDNKKDDGLAYIHILRFDKDKVVELWDFGHPVPIKSINENGVF